jgi:hypothetical protein
MAIGVTPTSLAGCGDRTRQCLPATAIGPHIAMDIGRGVRRTVGRGSATNHGVGRLITMAAGFITTATGPGCRAAGFIEIAVGGDRH